MRRLAWLPVLWLPMLAPACLDGGLDSGACNDNHVCEPHESYDVCPQDCYWHPDGAAVLGKQPARAADTTPWPGMAPADGEPFERVGNGVCELRESWRFSPDCTDACGDGRDDPGERATCLADHTLARARTECNNNGLCEFQPDPALAAALTSPPQETPYNCPLDCTPMGPPPALHIFNDDSRNNAACDPHENHANWPSECPLGCHDGCCAPGEESGPCPADCTLDAPIACPCSGDDCLQHCGDAILDPGELCDDGNSDNSDACTNACLPASCGDGFTQPPELCDDGNSIDNDACTSACTPPSSCGDSVLDPGEACDDGNSDDSDACTSLCQLPACGDGFLQPPELCDDGDANNDSAACLSTCTPASCGDGLIHTDVELCDDGDANDDSAACLSTCTPASCGDGLIQAGVELCDDNNSTDTDTCSNDCIPPRRVFVMTPVFGTGGNLGGILGADFLCENAASAADLDGTFKAWLTDGDPNTAPALRFESTTFTGWYLSTDGTPIAHGWDDLVSLDDNQTDFLKAPIHANEFGSDIGGEVTVWTNTGADGQQHPANKHCANWTNAMFVQSGAIGLSSSTVISEEWTQLAGTKDCTSDIRLYCFQTPP